MSRLPGITRDKLSTENQAVWDRIMAGRSGAGGPYGALFHVPGLADRVGAVENYFRFDGALPPTDRELVILTTARELGAHYPWNRHEIRGREAGVRTEAIEALRANGALDALTTHERLLVELAR
ncbi:MAG TPA: carboxymuconolactone decarboxylase family protein, partial [Methylomirabilota bacterium]|nr:carboxymuconolactone decarboxylase family protein [Methylomirabilota bacterium]